MRYLPDGEQMKAADTYTIQEIGVPSVVLMERAALKIVETMEQEQINTECTLIVCGSGNNGGDGFAVARLLLEKGKHVEVLFAGKESSLSEECRLQKEIVENLGIPVLKEFPEKRYTALLDAVFGVGLSREITGHYQEVIEWMNQQEAQKVAVDIPSGICSSTGRVLGIAFQAQLTVSMACEKLPLNSIILFASLIISTKSDNGCVGTLPMRSDVTFCATFSKIKYFETDASSSFAFRISAISLQSASI